MRPLVVLVLLSLSACSDSDNNSEAQALTLLPFETYSAAPQPRGGICEDTIDLEAPLIISGLGYDPENSRNSLSLINADNVSELTLNYSVATAGVQEMRGAAAVTAQAIFFTAGDRLSAINRDSGCSYWQYTNPTGQVFRSASVLLVIGDDGQATLYTGDYNGNVHAVNAADGSQRWQRFVGTNSGVHFITGGMQYHDGTLIVPVSSKEVVTGAFSPGPCCTSHGMVVALDGDNGDERWAYHTTAEADQIIEPGQRVGPNGAPVWATPTIDRTRNAVYVGTGQNYTEPSTETSDAIISLDLASGEVNWIFQATVNDTWNYACQFMMPLRCPARQGPDFDFGAAPILVNDGSALIAGDKGGLVYSLNPDTGAVNWSRKISTGSKLGGIHWGMAVDSDKVYAAATDFEIDTTSGSLEDLKSNANPGIYALRLSDGELLWEIHPSSLYQGLETPRLYSAALTVTNDVLFAGALNGTVNAFSTDNGSELWSFDANQSLLDINGNSGDGGTIDGAGLVIAGDGLIINSGYTELFGGVGRYQAGTGNTLLVLQLSD